MYRDFSGEDPYTGPMKVFPAMHYSMGGLWVDYQKDEKTGGMARVSPRNHSTTIPGLYACGECDYAYHGANRLGANSLLSASFSGRVAGDASVAYVKGLKKRAAATPDNFFKQEQSRQEEINQAIMTRQGGENPFALHHELGEIMRKHVFVEREQGAGYRVERHPQAQGAFVCISLDDRSGWATSRYRGAARCSDTIVLAEVITVGGCDECRGSLRPNLS